LHLKASLSATLRRTTFPLSGHLASTLQAKVAGMLCLRGFSSGICGRLDMPISTAATRT
ncbi:hypothetical protein BC831DRAFT_442567, partial [Entophlyctis helioformis]